MRYIDFGLMDYRQALTLQETLVCGISEGRHEETLLLGEHPCVYTIGRGGLLANRLDPTLGVERINRGGDITWHGPGQLVGYPLLDLASRGRDLHRWIDFLEELLIRTLDEFGIAGQRRPKARGVWTKGGKIAFIGVGVRRWVTMHGFSLNVSPDLRAFDPIHPCGLAGCPVTSMVAEARETIPVAAVKQRLQRGFSQLLPIRLPLDQAVALNPAPPRNRPVLGPG